MVLETKWMSPQIMAYLREYGSISDIAKDVSAEGWERYFD